MKSLATLLVLFILNMLCVARADEIRLVDDSGVEVSLPQAATRVISLAPHVTELVFAAGAGDTLIGVVEYSDFPPAAREIERIGDAFRFDFERIIELEPDLVLGWGNGNRSADIERLRKLGFAVSLIQPEQLKDIARNIRQIGMLTGHSDAAQAVSTRFLDDLQALGESTDTMASPERAPPIRVFYQIAESPLLTINRDHVINELIERCGGTNIFADLAPLIPQVSREAVLLANPQLIISAAEHADWTTPWDALESIAAVKHRYFLRLPADHISRASPRILMGGALICAKIGQIRSR